VTAEAKEAYDEVVREHESERLYETTLGWAWAHWKDAETLQSNGIEMVGIPVTLGETAATTLWMGPGDGPEEFLHELTYWLSRFGAELVEDGRSSSDA
jgi:hypothetical protein